MIFGHSTVDSITFTTDDNAITDFTFTGGVTASNDLAVADDFSVEGIVDFGTSDTMADNDLTPSVSGAAIFVSQATEDTITKFDDAVEGQIWIINHQGIAGETFDCDNTDGGNDDLQCGSADITASANDTTVWYYSSGGASQLISWVKNGSAQTGTDLAEWFPATEELEAGDVLVASSSDPVNVSKSSSGYQKGLIGIVATQPGLILGEQGTSTYAAQVALAGRVPVKVSDENGAIEIGDYLTSSATLSGYAMKATETGPVIGMAMEALESGSGLITVKVDNMWYSPSSDTLQGGNAAAVSSAETVTSGDYSFEGSVIVAEHLYGSRDMAGRVRLASGKDSVKVTFEKPYSEGSTPIITFSSRSNSDSAQGAWVSDESTTGFTINRSNSEAQVEFNWIAIGVNDAQVTVSDDYSDGTSVSVNDQNGPSAPAPVEPVAEEMAPAVDELVVEEPAVAEEAPAEEPAPEVPVVEELPVE